MDQLMNDVSVLAATKKVIEERAEELLKIAVDTGDLGVAWAVYTKLINSDLLEYYGTTLDERKFPCLNEVYENRADWFGRGQDVCFYQLIDYENLVLKPELEVPEWAKNEFDREKETARMWEAVRSGYAGFNNDW